MTGVENLAVETLMGMGVSEGNSGTVAAVAVVYVDAGDRIVSVSVPVDVNLASETGCVLLLSLWSLPIVQTGSYSFGRCYQATCRHRDPAVRLNTPMARWIVSRQTTCPGAVSSDCACYSPSKTFSSKDTRLYRVGYSNQAQCQ